MNKKFILEVAIGVIIGGILLGLVYIVIATISNLQTQVSINTQNIVGIGEFLQRSLEATQ